MNLYLIDGFSYIFRAFYALPELSSSKGEPTGAIYGFISMLLKIIRDKKPDALAIAFDSKEMTQREELYSLYKANRKVPPKELTAQIDPIIEIVNALGITSFALPGFEADDIIAKLALHSSKKGIDVFIVSSDKDLLQLVSPKVKIFDPVKNIVLDSDYVFNRFGLPPERVIEFLALTGDASDNIPGVKGVGEKTAKTLLSKAASLDDLINHPEEIVNPRIRDLISGNIENIKLSRELLTLKTDMELNPNIPLYKDIIPDTVKIKELFLRFELNSLLNFLSEKQVKSVKGDVLIKVQEIKTIKELDFIPDTLPEIFINIGLLPDNNPNTPVFGFSIDPKKGYFFTKHELIEPFINMLKRAERICGHDFKSISHIYPLDFKGIAIDTMLICYLIDPNKRDYSLKNILLEYLGHYSISDSADRGRLPFDNTLEVYGMEAALGLRLSQVISDKIKDNSSLIDIYNNIEYPLLWVLSDMEKAGCSIDSDRLHELSKDIEKEIDSLSRRIYLQAGCEFNINSPKELGRILFEQLRLPASRKTKTGYSTDTDVLLTLVERHPIAKELLEFRRITKLKNTYIDPLPTHINKATKRLHTTFNQTAAATGRLSSTRPNLQNIPIRGSGGEILRKAFIARDGYTLISADYSQIELRILAHLSGDIGMIDAFRQGLDIHSATGCEIFAVDIRSLTKDMRRIAKTVNFGVIYGQTPYGLSKTLNIPQRQAKDYIERYFRKYETVKKFIDYTIKEASKNGYTRTLMGRVRPIPQLKEGNNNQREHGERQAVNSPIQGSAADIIKIAMINIHKEIKDTGLKTKMVLQIHDELLLEAPMDELEEALSMVTLLMEGALQLVVPLKVDIGSGKDWASIK